MLAFLVSNVGRLAADCHALNRRPPAPARPSPTPARASCPAPSLAPQARSRASRGPAPTGSAGSLPRGPIRAVVIAPIGQPHIPARRRLRQKRPGRRRVRGQRHRRDRLLKQPQRRGQLHRPRMLLGESARIPLVPRLVAANASPAWRRIWPPSFRGMHLRAQHLSDPMRKHPAPFACSHCRGPSTVDGERACPPPAWQAAHRMGDGYRPVSRPPRAHGLAHRLRTSRYGGLRSCRPQKPIRRSRFNRHSGFP